MHAVDLSTKLVALPQNSWQMMYNFSSVYTFARKQKCRVFVLITATGKSCYFKLSGNKGQIIGNYGFELKIIENSK